MIKCKKCGVRKETKDFYTHPHTINGVQQPCKSCRAIRHQQQRKENLLVANTGLPLPYHNQAYLSKPELQKELEKCRKELDKSEIQLKLLRQIIDNEPSELWIKYIDTTITENLKKQNTPKKQTFWQTCLSWITEGDK